MHQSVSAANLCPNPLWTLQHSPNSQIDLGEGMQGWD